MRYENYPDRTKTFIVMQCSGFGVMEAPYEDVGIVYETDIEIDAYAKASELREKNNTSEQIQSSWVPNTYWIHVNTCTEKGKLLYEQFKKEADKSLERLKKNPNYLKIEMNGITVHITKDDTFFDNPKGITGSAMPSRIWDGKNWVSAPLESTKFTFLNFKKDGEH